MRKKNNSAQRLIIIREKLGYSQRQMAEEFGVAHGAIGLWESKKRKIPGPVLKLISLYENELGIASPAQKASYLSKLDHSWLARTTKITNLAIKNMGSLILNTIKTMCSNDSHSNAIRHSTKDAIAKQIIDTCGTLKGLPQKLGQILSYMDLNCTDDIRLQYEKLQYMSPPMPASRIVTIVLEELGNTPNGLFLSWDETPIASASIGQVHRAITKTEHPIVLKVQYPGIEKAIQSDLKNLTILGNLISLIIANTYTNDLIDEISMHLLFECDYRREAAHQMAAYHAYQDHPNIIIPKIHADLSSKSILTSDYIEGQSYRAFKKHASQSDINAAAKTICEFASHSIMQRHEFIADPHPGNYVFVGKGQVAFLDFGCVKSMSDEFHHHWMTFIHAIFTNNKTLVNDTAIAMGIIDRTKAFDFDMFYALMRHWYQPLYSKKAFTFTTEFVTSNWENMATFFTANTHIQCPKELLTINQLQWGLYAILADLNATATWSNIVYPFLK